MLSPKEFATLMLVKAAPDQIDMCREELDTLLERQLVALEDLASGTPAPACHLCRSCPCSTRWPRKR